MSKTEDSGHAEEVTQESFLRLFRYLKEQRSLDNPKTWLFTVADNFATDASRRDNHIADRSTRPSASTSRDNNLEVSSQLK